MATDEEELQKVPLNGGDDIGNEVTRSRRAVSSGEPSSDGSVDEERSALSDSDLPDALRIRTIATQAKGPSSDALEVECRAEQKSHMSNAVGDSVETEEKADGSGKWVDLVGNGKCELLYQVLKNGNGQKPRNGQEVSIYVVDRTFGIDSHSELTFILGYSMVIEAWELCVSTMSEKEIGILKSSCRFAYGSIGDPERHIPPNQIMEYEIHILRLGKTITVSETPKELVVHYTQPLNDRGKYYYNRNEYNKAIFVYKRCIDLAGTSTKSDDDIRNLISLVYSNLAACYAKLGDWKASLNSTTESLKLNDSNKKALFRQAVAYRNLNMAAEASRSLEAAQKIDPYDTAVANELRISRILERKCCEQEKKLYKKMLAGVGTKNSLQCTLLTSLSRFLCRNRYWISCGAVLLASIVLYFINISFYSYISSMTK